MSDLENNIEIKTENLEPGLKTPDKLNELKKIIKTKEKNSISIEAKNQIYEKLEEIENNDNIKNIEILKNETIDNIKSKNILIKNKKLSISALKSETTKRLKAYTTIEKDNWLKINYAKFGYDKTGKSHEMNIGLGDLLLDPQIKNIIVKKQNGELIEGTRVVNEKKGIHFVDKNGKYIATYTGDQIKIKNIQKTTRNKENLQIETENIARQKHVKQIHETNISPKEELEISQLTEEEKLNVKINTKTIDYAAQLSKKPQRVENLNQPLKILISKVSKHFKVPQSLIMATFKAESNFVHNITGDKHLTGKAIGIGQFRPATFNSIQNTNSFKTYMRIHYPNRTQAFQRGENILADIAATAIFLKQIAQRGNINLEQPLSKEALVFIRAGYNAGPGNAQKYLNKFKNGENSKLVNAYNKFANITQKIDLISFV